MSSLHAKLNKKRHQGGLPLGLDVSRLMDRVRQESGDTHSPMALPRKDEPSTVCVGHAGSHNPRR